MVSNSTQNLHPKSAILCYQSFGPGGWTFCGIKVIKLLLDGGEAVTSGNNATKKPLVSSPVDDELLETRAPSHAAQPGNRYLWQYVEESEVAKFHEANAEFLFRNATTVFTSTSWKVEILEEILEDFQFSLSDKEKSTLLDRLLKGTLSMWENESNVERVK